MSSQKCPQCKGSVRRLIGTGCGLIFKGNGFYITDYKKKSSSDLKKNNKKETTSCNSACPAKMCPESAKRNGE